MALRPQFIYHVLFSHPNGSSHTIPVVETTPCRAKQTALVRHTALLKADPALPQDNAWRLSGPFTVRQLGFIEQ